MFIYSTGEKAPVTATYKFTGHIDNTSCQPIIEDQNITLSARDTFPPCKSCKAGVYWGI